MQWIPCVASTRAASAANCSERNRVSYPMTIPRDPSPVSVSVSAIAWQARRAFAKVNRSAITSRHPEVPNLLAHVIFDRQEPPSCPVSPLEPCHDRQTHHTHHRRQGRTRRKDRDRASGAPPGRVRQRAAARRLHLPL